MPYDSNGFNYQGESVLNLYNTTRKYTSEVSSSNFKKNGTDIATLITPAFHSSDGTNNIGIKTNNAYKGFPDKNNGDGINFDTAFSVSEPDIRGRVKPSTYKRIYGTTRLQLGKGNNGYIYYAYAPTTGSAKNEIILRTASTLDILVVGGGGGGASGWSETNTSAGTGGGGAGALVTGTYSIPYERNVYFSVSGGDGGSRDSGPGNPGSNGSSTTLTIGGNSIVAYGGQGAYNNRAGPSAPGGSGSGGAKHKWDDWSIAVAAPSLATNGYSNSNPSITNITLYRNKGAVSGANGWAGGGGGGAGGEGGGFQGDVNNTGGDGGSAKYLFGDYWAGGGGGSGNSKFIYEWGNGSHGGAQKEGSGSGGNSTTADGANGSWNTTDGYSGSAVLEIPSGYYFDGT